MEPTDPMCYVGRRPCGCVAYAAVDRPAAERRNDIARDVAEMIREGWTVERQTAAWVRSNWGPGCAQCSPAAVQEQLL